MNAAEKAERAAEFQRRGIVKRKEIEASTDRLDLEIDASVAPNEYVCLACGYHTMIAARMLSEEWHLPCPGSHHARLTRKSEKRISLTADSDAELAAANLIREKGGNEYIEGKLKKIKTRWRCVLCSWSTTNSKKYALTHPAKCKGSEKATKAASKLKLQKTMKQNRDKHEDKRHTAAASVSQAKTSGN